MLPELKSKTSSLPYDERLYERREESEIGFSLIEPIRFHVEWFGEVLGERRMNLPIGAVVAPLIHPRPSPLGYFLRTLRISQSTVSRSGTCSKTLLLKTTSKNESGKVILFRSILLMCSEFGALLLPAS